MGIIITVKEIDRALSTMEAIGIANEEDRQWLELIERRVDDLREIRRLKEKVEEFDSRIQIIWDRYECYQNELDSLGNNWW